MSDFGKATSKITSTLISDARALLAKYPYRTVILAIILVVTGFLTAKNLSGVKDLWKSIQSQVSRATSALQPKEEKSWFGGLFGGGRSGERSATDRALAAKKAEDEKKAEIASQKPLPKSVVPPEAVKGSLKKATDGGTEDTKWFSLGDDDPPTDEEDFSTASEDDEKTVSQRRRRSRSRTGKSMSKVFAQTKRVLEML
ncbi:MAG: hypothetical protein CMB64_05245 [Euryarchaeota archaeon]|nr:hypothetical protein [Euryarchaeota archaeon]